MHARLALANIRFNTDPAGTLPDLLSLAREATVVFEQVGDEPGLMQASIAIANVEHFRCHWGGRNQALERALDHARNIGDQRWTENILMRLGNGYYCGPTPVAEALRWHAAQRSLELRRPLVMSIRAIYEAMQGRFDRARSLRKEALERAEELGDQIALANDEAGYVIEMLAGDAVEAERNARRACELLERMGDRGWLASYAGLLAQALVGVERYEEAEHWARRAQQMSWSDDVDAQKRWRQARARVAAQRGSLVEAERLAREALELVEQTDMTSDHGDALMDLATVLRVSDRYEEAANAVEQALALYERKGNVVMAERARSTAAQLRGPGDDRVT